MCARLPLAARRSPVRARLAPSRKARICGPFRFRHSLPATPPIGRRRLHSRRCCPKLPGVTSRSQPSGSGAVAADAPRGDAGRSRGSAVERRLVPIRFAFTRLRAHASRTVLVAAGIAVAAAMLAMAAVAAVAVQDRAVQRALAELQPTDRAVQVDWSGVPAQSNLSLAQLDRVARAALRPVLSRPPFGVLVFRQATWGGAFVNLGAVDGLSRWLVLRSGRLPRDVHGGRLRARPDRRRTGRAEAPVSPRRRPRDHPGRRAARRLLRRGGREPAADPPRRRRARLLETAASGCGADRAHGGMDRAGRARGDPRVGDPRLPAAARSRAEPARVGGPAVQPGGADRHAARDSRDDADRREEAADRRRRRGDPAARIRGARVDAAAPRSPCGAASSALVRRAAFAGDARRRDGGAGDHGRRDDRRLAARDGSGCAARAASRRARRCGGRALRRHRARAARRGRARRADRRGDARRRARRAGLLRRAPDHDRGRRRARSARRDPARARAREGGRRLARLRRRHRNRAARPAGAADLRPRGRRGAPARARAAAARARGPWARPCPRASRCCRSHARRGR